METTNKQHRAVNRGRPGIHEDRAAMAFVFDPEDRAAFRAALIAHVAAALPDAVLTWDTTYDRQLTATFPDGVRRSIWEPNFYFSRGEHFSDATLLAQAAAWLGDRTTPEVDWTSKGETSWTR
jgi:hypothetical protein